MTKNVHAIANHKNYIPNTNGETDKQKNGIYNEKIATTVQQLISSIDFIQQCFGVGVAHIRGELPTRLINSSELNREMMEQGLRKSYEHMSLLNELECELLDFDVTLGHQLTSSINE